MPAPTLPPGVVSAEVYACGGGRESGPGAPPLALIPMAGSRSPSDGRGGAPGKVGGAAAPLGDAAEVERVFRHYDANGDGKISAAELADVLRALSASGGGGAAPEEEARRMMEEMDADHDGYVDLAEFVAFHRDGGGGAAAAADGDRELKEAFRMYDQNGDGRISPRELHQVLKRLGDKCSIRDCSRMISSVDGDGDGCVDFHEFKRMMTGGANCGGKGRKDQRHRK